MYLKDIHIGKYIEARVLELAITNERICNYFQLEEVFIKEMYNERNMDTKNLMMWSKLLEYDFFRLFSQHLILYAPQGNQECTKTLKKTSLPQFRKSIYTKNLIEFVLNEIEKGEKTKSQVIEYYGIPKTTLYRWINKKTR